MNTELIAYYVNLLILQYRSKPNATGTTEALITLLMIFDLIGEVNDGFDIDTAVGAQLDIIGKYHDAHRTVSIASGEGSFFASIPVSQALPTEGACGSIRDDEATLPPFQQFTYETIIGAAVELNDTDYRQLIKAKLFVNTTNHSASDTYTFVEQFFPGQNIFADNQDMTITYLFSETVRRQAEIFLSQNALPKPGGVGLTMSFLPQLDDLFSLISYDTVTPPAYAAGYIRYGDTPIGGWLRYGS